ncbi:hypothetical protein ACFCZ1_32980, partial [Streptomyces sp. NPDC056224]
YMTQTITGKDNLSKRILHEIEGGLRISEVPKLYPVSLDQAKRLSRFNNMLNKAKKQLNLEQYERLELLGLKSLPLSGLIKNSDWAFPASPPGPARFAGGPQQRGAGLLSPGAGGRLWVGPARHGAALTVLGRGGPEGVPLLGGDTVPHVSGPAFERKTGR